MSENKLDEKELVSQPTTLDVTLYQHQLHSIWRMEYLEQHKHPQNNNIMTTGLGINSDPTGYGKTLSMIGLIVRDKMPWDLTVKEEIKYTQTFASKLITFTSVQQCRRVRPTLILVNTSLISQWESELSKSKLDVYKVAHIKDFKNFNLNHDVILVSLNIFNNLIAKVNATYGTVCWKRFIFDEPSNVRVPSMSPVISGFTWLVTATPEILYPKHRHCTRSYMHSLVRDIDGYHWGYHILSELKIQNSLEYIKQSFEMPPTNHITYQCFSPMVNTVRDSVSPKVRELLNANNIEGALDALGGKKTDNIVDLILKEKDREIKGAQVWIDYHNNMISGNEEKDVEHRKKIGEWTAKRDHLISQTKELKIKFEDMLNGNCSICVDSLKNPVMEPKCQNIFCGDCLLKWLVNSTTCPLCRTIINTSELIHIKEKGTIEEKKELKKQYLTKEQIILNILQKNKNKRFLIFSSYYESFNTIYTLLKENKYIFAEIKGQQSVIDRNISLFKKGEIPIIFLNSKYNGSGLNLQEATDIILYHEMDEYLQRQVIGRANRIGRTSSLTVHHLKFE